MSYHTLSTKPLNKSLKALLKRASHVGLGLGAFTPVLALANPTGGHVVAGQASITSPAANDLVVRQASQSAIINWQQFNIGANEYVQFLQPSSSSVVLNRVVGGNASSIFGNLTANGQVFLVNTNGVFFGHGASIDTQGFLASSLDINDSDFLSRHYLFNKSGSGTAKVVNQGNIVAHKGGYVVLAGDYAENDGIISAQSGHVILASGAKSTLTLSGNRLVSYVVNGATLSSLAGVDNAGKLVADGGTVIMTADVANALKATVVNNTGLVEARSISRNNGGIFLTAAGGNIVNAGTLDADAIGAGHVGGNITLKGDGRTNLTSTSKITAQGIAGAGGHVELSGNVLNVRGTANLGKGGRLLLDPGSVSISAGNNSSFGTSLNTTSVGHVGVNFIETTLNAGNDVIISAAHAINHAGSVTAITGNNAAGDLDLHVGTNGHINLAGVGINIKGKLTAEMGYGSFGNLVAGSIDLNASHGLVLAHALKNTHGVITTQSALTTTGDLNLHGSAIRSDGEGSSHSAGLSLKAKTDLDVQGNILNAKTVTAAASHGYAHFQGIQASNGITLSDTVATSADSLSANWLTASGGNIAVTGTGTVKTGVLRANNGAVTVSAKDFAVHSGESGATAIFGKNGVSLTAATLDYTGPGDFIISGGSAANINVKGVFGTTAEGLAKGLELITGKSVNVNKNIKVAGDLLISAANLAYTGRAHSFSASASNGDFTLNANIGTAAAPVKYNVTLKDQGYGLFIEKSIFTGSTAQGAAANITATETGRHSGATSHAAIGVLVGDSEFGVVTLSAKGSVTLSGDNVGVGSVLSSNHSGSYGPVTIGAGRDVSMTATGALSHSGGHVTVEAGNAVASYGGTPIKSNNILVSAGHNLSLTGPVVAVHGGIATATLTSIGTANLASANATVTLKAGNKVTMTGGTTSNASVDIQGGSAFASARADGAGQTRTANANATVTISGNNGVTLQGHHVNVEAGYGVGGASAAEGSSGKHGAVTANANANGGVAIKSKSGTITLTGGSAENGRVLVQGNHKTGSSGYAGAFSSHANATATAHGDVSLSAGGGIALSATDIQVSGGYGAGRQNSSAEGGVTFPTEAFGHNVNAALTATDGVTFNAGATGISMTAGDGVFIAGGGGSFSYAGVQAGGSGAKATMTGNGRVDLKTSGNVALTAHNNIFVTGGLAAGQRAAASGEESGTAIVTADGGVGINAANITIGSGGEGSLNILVAGGGDAASHVYVHGSESGAASFTAKARVDLAATGKITMTAAHNISVAGGYSADANGQVDASNGGHATLNGNTGVGLTAGGAISLTGGAGSGHDVLLQGGGGGAVGAQVTADGSSGAVAQANALSSVNVAAGGNFTAKASQVFVDAGYGVGFESKVTADGSSGGKATVNANGSVNLSAANVTLMGSNVNIRGGGAAGGGSTFEGVQHYTQVVAGGNSGNLASEAANAFVNIKTPGTFTVTATTGTVNMSAGSSGAFLGHASAEGSNTALLNTDSNLTVIAGAAKITATNGQVFVDAGYGAARAGKAHASGEGADAEVNAAAGTFIVAKTGSISITGKTGVHLNGGASAAAGRGRSYSSTTTDFSGPSSSSSTVRHHHHHVVSYASATAGGAAKATVNGNAVLTLSGKTGISLTQTSTSGGSLTVEGGNNTAYRAHASAAGGAAATVTGTGAVTLNGPTVALKGRNVFVQGGDGAGRGAERSTSNYSGTHFTHSGASSPVSGNSAEGPANGAFAIGAGAQAKVSGDGSILIKGSTVSLTATGNSLEISGGYGNGSHAQLLAIDGGSANVNGAAAITISAKSAFTAKASGANGFVQIEGGGGSGGYGAAVQASFSSGGVFSKAQINGNSQVNITAPTVTVTAASAIYIEGGWDIASNHANVTAAYGGFAAINGVANVNIAVASKFAASLSGSGNEGGVVVQAGGDAAEDGANISAHGSSAQALVSANQNVNITAAGSGGVISLSTGNREAAVLQVVGGRHNGGGNGGSSMGAQVNASNGGSAAAVLNANVNLTAAKGTVNLIAKKGNVEVGETRNAGSFANGRGVSVDAGYGTATFTANNNTNVSAVNIKLIAGTFVNGSHSSGGNISVQTGASRNAQSAHVVAGSSGAASFTVNDQVNLKATGALTMAAGSSLDVGGCCSHHEAAGAKASGSGAGANAILNVNDSTLLQGNAAVSLTAGNDISLTTVSGPSGTGSAAGAVAKAHGTATYSNIGQLNIKTNGAFSMKAAGSEATLFAGLGARHGYATASGAGATATNLTDGSLNITANTVTITASNQINVSGGDAAAWNAEVTAKHGGSASLNANRSLNITARSAIALSLTGSANGGTISIGSGGTESGAGRGAEAIANSHGGKAKVVGTDATNLTVTGKGGTVTLNAGKHTGAAIRIRSQGGAGGLSFSSSPRFTVAAAGAGGSASLDLVADTNISARGAVLINAGNSGNISFHAGANTMVDGHASASVGKANLNAHSVINLAGGSVTFTAGGDISVTAASGVARGTGPSSSFFTRASAHNGGSANLTATTGVKITAAGAFTATAGGNLGFFDNGQSSNAKTAASARIHASHGGAEATLTGINTIQVNAATIALKAVTGSLAIVGGSSGARGALISAAARNDQATVNVDDSVTFNATGNFSAKAGGDMFVVAGADAGSSASVYAQARGTAKLGVNSTVNIKAGGTLSMTATGNLTVAGGSSVGGILNAQSGGLASASYNAGVNLTAGKSAALGAGGDLTLTGGDKAFLLADQFFSRSSGEIVGKGKVNGTLTTAINLTAHSSATLAAGGNLTIEAAAGETVAVGMFRASTPSGGPSVRGNSWGGGSANLDANVGAAVTAGKNVTLSAGTAGSGSLHVLGLRANPLAASEGLENIVSVRGGSNSATANLTMTGNALVTAGGTITVNAAGNASIVGGVINDVRADHPIGDVTLTGSANALLHAGLDVKLNNIGGSLTVVGANAGPSEQGMLVDAHGNFGTAVAIGHADGGISAGRDIVSVKALGGGLNLIGGDLVDAVALGSASSQHADGTANATLKAGRNIIVSGAGGLNLLGGQFDAASASASGHTSFSPSGTRTATLQAHAAVAAGGAAMLKFTGDGFLAGGDSVAANVTYNGGSFATGTATADAGVSITGKSVSLTIGGDLLARGGSGAKGAVTLLGGGLMGSASANVGVNVAASQGNVAIVVGGSASFLAGSGVGGKAVNISGFGGGSFGSTTFGGPNTANATAKADVSIAATGNVGVTLTGTGNLTIAGAPSAEPFGTDAGGAGSSGRFLPSSLGKATAPNGETNVTASGMVSFTAGGALTVTQHGGNLTILGGSNMGSFASAQAVGSDAHTTMTVNTGVLFQAGGALKITGVHDLTVLAGAPAVGPSGSAFPGNYLLASGSGATVTEKLDGTIKFVGSSVTINTTGTRNVSSGTFSFMSGGNNFSYDGAITGLPALSHGLVVHSGMLRVAPATSGTSFGGTQPLSAPVTVSGAAAPAAVDVTPAAVSVETRPVALSTLQSASLVPSLVTLMGADAGTGLGASLASGATLYKPAVNTASYSKAFSGACTALVVQGSDARCSTGGK